MSQKRIIRNPILRGFNPDPSIIRVDDNYYIATSTFEWFPGVQIHHSKDLINWKLLTRPLNRISQLDMRGIPNSGGIWAPCLSYNNETFFLCYTIVHELNGVAKDTPNYLVTANDIMGPWSEPVYLNSSGFDPSLFHDDNCKTWLVNMVWDHRPGKNPFYGIVLQEYSIERQKLIGKSQIIFKGTKLGSTEGPHLYRKEDYYYLITAEGGTGWNHAITMARSNNIYGPYEVHPENPILTSCGHKSLPLQKAGHGDIVETPNGDWYMVYLCSRPLPGRDRCILGRETAIQKVIWKEDGWLYVDGGGNHPREIITAPNHTEKKWNVSSIRDDFDNKEIGIQYQVPRVPLDENSFSLSERPGYLRLKGGESLESKFNQVIIARRQESFRYEAITLLEFNPKNFQQLAGMVCYYNTKLYHYLCMSLDELSGTCLYVQTADDGNIVYPLGTKFISLNHATRVFLKAKMDYDKLSFYYSFDGENWMLACKDLDSSILSDDYGDDWGFTGAFVGLACQDMSGRRIPADFDFFEYREIE